LPDVTRRYYYRLESPTQTREMAEMVARSRELCGQANRGSQIPSVDAYVGALPDDAIGMEFVSDVPPDPGSPPGRARWTGPRPGVAVFTDDDGVEWAAIPVEVTQIRARKAP
jgi:hypothetical protein